jgi:hypothetical protein
MQINTDQSTQCYKPEDSHLHPTRRENPKSYVCKFGFKFYILALNKIRNKMHVTVIILESEVQDNIC